MNKKIRKCEDKNNSSTQQLNSKRDSTSVNNLIPTRHTALHTQPSITSPPHPVSFHHSAICWHTSMVPALRQPFFFLKISNESNSTHLNDFFTLLSLICLSVSLSPRDLLPPQFSLHFFFLS